MRRGDGDSVGRTLVSSTVEECSMAENGVPKALEALMKRAAQRRPAGPLGTVGRYELLELVGAGAHGRVYRARDPGNNQLVAIKVLHEDVKNAELELRMKREAYAMGQL